MTSALRASPRTRSPALRCLLGAVLLAAPVSAEAATLKLAWDPVVSPQLAGYKLHYDTDAAGAPYAGVGAIEGASPVGVSLAQLPDPGNPTLSLTVPSCQSYFLAVTAYDPEGVESPFSNQIQKSAVDAPAAVTVTPVSGATPSFRVSWAGLDAQDSGAVDRYRVRYGLNPTPPHDDIGGSGAAQGLSPITVPVASLSAPFDTQLGGLSPGMTYYVAVEAVCADGTAKLSTPVVIAIPSSSGASGDASSNGGGASSDGGIVEDEASGASEVGAGGGCSITGPPQTGARGHVLGPIAILLLAFARVRRHALP